MTATPWRRRVRPDAAKVLATLLLWTGPASCGRSGPDRPDDLAVNPSVAAGADSLPADRVRAYLAGALGFTSRGGRVFCSYAVLGQERARVHLWALCEELVPAAGSLESGSGVGGPVALLLDTLARPARIAGHRVPRDGGRHARDVEEIFPAAVRRRMSAGTGEHNRRAEMLQRANRDAAAAFYRGPNVPPEAP